MPEIRTGRRYEDVIKDMFSRSGFEVVPFRSWTAKPLADGSELLLTHAAYTNVYGTPGYTEFVIKSRKLPGDVRVECKWQQTSGSVDEKMPYVYLNCVEAMPEDHIIVVIGGGGFREGAVRWFQNAVATGLYLKPGAPEKKISVMRGLDEFITWANVTLF